MDAKSLILLSIAITAGDFPGFRRRTSAQAERNDPEREKTPEDLRRLAAAQAKRDRRAARRANPRPSVTAGPPAAPTPAPPDPCQARPPQPEHITKR